MSLSTGRPGDEIFLLTEGNGSNGEFTLGFSANVSLYDITGAKMSALYLELSKDNGSCFIHLKCFANDTWSVIEINPKDNNPSIVSEL